eukprot:4078694-Amphidinium_carterae.1
MEAGARAGNTEPPRECLEVPACVVLPHFMVGTKVLDMRCDRTERCAVAARSARCNAAVSAKKMSVMSSGDSALRTTRQGQGTFEI